MRRRVRRIRASCRRGRSRSRSRRRRRLRVRPKASAPLRSAIAIMKTFARRYRCFSSVLAGTAD